MATPHITPIRGVPRQQGIQTPRLNSAADWVDSFVLAQNVVETYTLPVDAAGNRALTLRIYTSGTLYIRWDGVAAVPAADVTDGTGSVALTAASRRYYSAPNTAYTLSLITPTAAGSIVTIEAWS